MKSKLTKILGIVVVMATVASLLVGFTASPVSAATTKMAFTPASSPSNINNFLGGDSYAQYFAVNPTVTTYATPVAIGNPHINGMAATPDGKTIYAWDNTAKALYMSADSGKTWNTSLGINTQNATFVGLAISPKYATDSSVVLATADEVWLVTAADTTAVSVTGNLDTMMEFTGTRVTPTGGLISSIDCGYYYSTNILSIVIGVKAGAGAYSNVLLFQTGGFSWTEVGSTTNMLKTGSAGFTAPAADPQVLAVKFSPNHLADAEIMAVYSYSAQTWIGSCIGTLGWNNAICVATSVVPTVAAAGAVIAVGTDYLGNTGASVLVGTVGINAPTNGVYIVKSRGATAGVPTQQYAFGASATDGIQSIAVSGPLATGTVAIGMTNTNVIQVCTGITGTSVVFTASNNYKNPSGTANANVQFVGSTSNLLCSTTGLDSAISISADAVTNPVGGADFNQIGLIDIGGVGATATIATVNGTGGITGISAISNGGVGYANTGTDPVVTVLGGGYGAVWATGNVSLSTTYAAAATSGAGTLAGTTFAVTATNTTGGITAAAVATSAAGYAVNDTVTLPVPAGTGGTAAVLKVLTVTGPGAIITVSVTTAGVGYALPTGVAALAVPGTAAGTGYAAGQTIIITNSKAASLASAGSFSTIANSGGHKSGLYQSTDAGASWVRILLLAGSIGRGTSPAYATDKTYIVTAPSSPIALQTTNAGVSFSPIGSPVNINFSMMIENGQFYIGGPGAAQFYLSGRYTNATFTPTTTGVVNSIARSPIDKTLMTLMVGLNNGQVYQSTDGGVTFNQIGTAGVGGSTADLISAAYGPDGTIWAAPQGAIGAPPAVTGIYEWVPSTSSWLNVTATASTPIACGAGAGFYITPDGTMYAYDCTMGNGVWRSLNYNHLSAGGVSDAVWAQINGTNFPGGTTSATMGTAQGGFPGIAGTSKISVGGPVVAATGNTLYIKDSSSVIANTMLPSAIYTFVDTFIVGPKITAPTDGTLLATDVKATMTWAALDGPGAGALVSNTNYAAQLTTSNDFTGATTPLLTLDTYTAGNLIQTVGVNPGGTTNNLTGGTKYWWRVQATSPIPSRYTTATFTTALNQVSTTAVDLFPIQGAVDTTITPTFAWPAVTGATGYEFVIAEETGQQDKFAIIDLSANTITDAYKLAESLKYNTTYWWRVRATIGDVKGAWSTFFFTTMQKPVATTATATTPAIVITTAPAPEITLQIPPSPSPVQVIPPYLLWAVIGVGAILVIAVIVLIVRTRRIS
jgi:hypothetical protein